MAHIATIAFNELARADTNWASAASGNANPVGEGPASAFRGRCSVSPSPAVATQPFTHIAAPPSTRGTACGQGMANRSSAAGCQHAEAMLGEASTKATLATPVADERRPAPSSDPEQPSRLSAATTRSPRQNERTYRGSQRWALCVAMCSPAFPHTSWLSQRSSVRAPQTARPRCHDRRRRTPTSDAQSGCALPHSAGSATRGRRRAEARSGSEHSPARAASRSRHGR